MGAYTADFDTGSDSADFTSENSWSYDKTNMALTKPKYTNNANGVKSGTLALRMANKATNDAFGIVRSDATPGAGQPNSLSGTVYTRAYYYIDTNAFNGKFLAIDYTPFYILYFSRLALTGMVVDSAGKLYIGQEDGSGTLVYISATGVIPFGAKFRLEVKFVNGVCTEVRVFKGANLDGTTADVAITDALLANYTINLSDAGGPNNPSQPEYGRVLGVASTKDGEDIGFGYMPWLPSGLAVNVDCYIDAVDTSTSGWVGAYAGGGGGTTVTTASPTAFTTTKFAPTVTVTNNKIVIPSITTLTTTKFAPTVVATSNKLVTPAIATLTTTKFAPTVTVSDNKVVIPSVATLTTSTFAPTVNVSDNKLVTPSTASLTTSTWAITVATTANQWVMLSTASLTITGFAPSVTTTANQFITLDTANLTLTQSNPSVSLSDNIDLSPSTASLNITEYAPDVAISANVEVNPDIANLTTQGQTPLVFVNTVVTPEVANLVASLFPPSVDVGQSVYVLPLSKALTITTFKPIVNHSVTARKYYIDSDGNVYWVINQAAGIVEPV